MKRKTIVSALCFCLLTATSFNSYAVDKQQRNADLFTKIEVSSAIDLYLTQGDIQTLHVEADAGMIDKVVTTSKGGKLRIEVKGKIKGNEKSSVRVYVTVPKIEEIVASGAVDVNIQTPILSQDKISIKLGGASELNNGNITAKAVALTLSGASHCGITIDAESIAADLSGASDLKLKGRTTKLSVGASGASSFDATGFDYGKSSISSSEGSSIQLSKK